MPMPMTADEFVLALQDLAGPPVCDERTLLVSPSTSLGPKGRGTASVHVTLVNLPFARFKERRGGGAETENNRMLFFVRGFNEGDATGVPVVKVEVEQLVNNVGYLGEGAPKLRRKTADPHKIATYLAKYLQDVVSRFPPNLTHD